MDSVVSFLQRRGWELKLTMKHSIKYMYVESVTGKYLSVSWLIFNYQFQWAYTICRYFENGTPSQHTTKEVLPEMSFCQLGLTYMHSTIQTIYCMPCHTISSSDRQLYVLSHNLSLTSLHDFSKTSQLVVRELGILESVGHFHSCFHALCFQ